MQSTAASRSKLPGLARFLFVAALGLAGVYIALPFLGIVAVSNTLAATYVLLVAGLLLVTLVIVPLPRTPWSARAAQQILVALLLCLGTSMLPALIPAWLPLAILVIVASGTESPRWTVLLAFGAGMIFAPSTKSTDAQAWAASMIGFVGVGAVSVFTLARLKARNVELGGLLTRMRQGADYVDTEPSIQGVRLNLPKAAPSLRKVSDESRKMRDLERSENLTQALAPFLELARGMNRAHAALFFDIDRKRGGAFLRASDGPPELIREDSVMPLDTDPLAFVLDRTKAFYATDYRALLWSLPYYKKEVKIGTILAAPVVVRGVVSGVLVVDHEESQALSNAEPIVIRLAGLIAQAVESARETVAHQERGVEFEAAAFTSQSLALLTEVPEIHGFVTRAVKEMAPRTIGCGIVRLHGETIDALPGASEQFQEWIGVGSRTSERTWISWYLGGNAEPCRISRPSEGSLPLFRPGAGFPGETLLAHPLRFRNRLQGALIAIGEDNAFDASVEHVLSLVSNQAAAAIDLIQLVEANRELALHDGLTGLLNRRAFDEALARAVAQSSRGGQPVSLLMLDIDHFKTLNDSWGHSVGDLALQATAAEVKAQVRAGDLGARYGGEEFAIILPDTDGAAAFRLAERIRKAVADRAVNVGRNQVRVTASFGVSATDIGYETPEELMRSADEALYASKETGRNRTSLAGAPRR